MSAIAANTGQVPLAPKVYHILHVDRLASVMSEGRLWSDAEVLRRGLVGTPIGMSDIKLRRLEELELASHPGLRVGQCVPFYFCPRSVMLFLLHKGNHPNLSYRGGQGPILHLEADLTRVVQWAGSKNLRWAFTLSNAGAYYFEDRCELAQLGEIDWAAVRATDWRHCQDGKQAEFLVESEFPWELVDRIGVVSQSMYNHVTTALAAVGHRPRLEIRGDWYY